MALFSIMWYERINSVRIRSQPSPCEGNTRSQAAPFIIHLESSANKPPTTSLFFCFVMLALINEWLMSTRTPSMRGGEIKTIFNIRHFCVAADPVARRQQRRYAGRQWERCANRLITHTPRVFINFPQTTETTTGQMH